MNKSKGRILIIDNSRSGWVDFFTPRLEEAGYIVQAVRNTNDASHLLEKEAFNLILIDLTQAKEESKPVKKLAGLSLDERRLVVMVPTQLTPSKMRVSFKLGACDCVDKPFDRGGLIEMVERELAESYTRKRS